MFKRSSGTVAEAVITQPVAGTTPRIVGWWMGGIAGMVSIKGVFVKVFVMEFAKI